MINGLYAVLINGVPKIKHKDAIDVSTPHTLADLVAAVCSETEAAALIAANTIIGTVPSEVLRNSNDDLKETTQTVYTKVKEVLLNDDLPSCRIKFDLSAPLGEWSKGKIYKNGVSIGTERSNNSATAVTFSEDFTGFQSGDLIQIYGLNEAGGSYKCSIRNMRFYYTHGIAAIGASTLETPLPDTNDPVISMTNQDP